MTFKSEMLSEVFNLNHFVWKTKCSPDVILTLIKNYFNARKVFLYNREKQELQYYTATYHIK